jgi:hypothetical protein
MTTRMYRGDARGQCLPTIRRARLRWPFYLGRMRQETEPSQAAVEAAVEETLKGWAAELYNGQKFWWMYWDRLIQDTLTALRTGEAVGIDDYGEGDVRPQWGAEQTLAVGTKESCPT